MGDTHKIQIESTIKGGSAPLKVVTQQSGPSSGGALGPYQVHQTPLGALNVQKDAMKKAILEANKETQRVMLYRKSAIATPMPPSTETRGIQNPLLERDIKYRQLIKDVGDTSGQFKNLLSVLDPSVMEMPRFTESISEAGKAFLRAGKIVDQNSEDMAKLNEIVKSLTEIGDLGPIAKPVPEVSPPIAMPAFTKSISSMEKAHVNLASNIQRMQEVSGGFDLDEDLLSDTNETLEQTAGLFAQIGKVAGFFNQQLFDVLITMGMGFQTLRRLRMVITAISQTAKTGQPFTGKLGDVVQGALGKGDDVAGKVATGGGAIAGGGAVAGKGAVGGAGAAAGSAGATAGGVAGVGAGTLGVALLAVAPVIIAALVGGIGGAVVGKVTGLSQILMGIAGALMAISTLMAILFAVAMPGIGLLPAILSFLSGIIASGIITIVAILKAMWDNSVVRQTTLEWFKKFWGSLGDIVLMGLLFVIHSSGKIYDGITLLRGVVGGALEILGPIAEWLNDLDIPLLIWQGLTNWWDAKVEGFHAWVYAITHPIETVRNHISSLLSAARDIYEWLKWLTSSAAWENSPLSILFGESLDLSAFSLINPFDPLALFGMIAEEGKERAKVAISILDNFSVEAPFGLGDLFPFLPSDLAGSAEEFSPIPLPTTDYFAVEAPFNLMDIFDIDSLIDIDVGKKVDLTNKLDLMDLLGDFSLDLGNVSVKRESTFVDTIIDYVTDVFG